MRGLGLLYACSCLSAFIIMSSFQLVNYVKFPYCLRSAGSGSQIYYSSSLFKTYYGNFCCNTRQAPSEKAETCFVTSVTLGLSILLISLTLNTGISHSVNF